MPHLILQFNRGITRTRQSDFYPCFVALTWIVKIQLEHLLLSSNLIQRSEENIICSDGGCTHTRSILSIQLISAGLQLSCFLPLCTYSCPISSPALIPSARTYTSRWPLGKRAVGAVQTRALLWLLQGARNNSVSSLPLANLPHELCCSTLFLLFVSSMCVCI